MKCWEFWKCELKDKCPATIYELNDGECWMVGIHCPRNLELSGENKKIACLECEYFIKYSKMKEGCKFYKKT
ncbi:MAG: hypothetical protein HZA07_03395 [Nitrospirae bacterium]|nr:hypothetical protein [Nitrospirota bacterium]